MGSSSALPYPQLLLQQPLPMSQQHRLDNYVIDTLMRDLVGHDRQPCAFLVYLLLWRLSAATGAKTPPISNSELAELTGLSERSIQTAVRTLKQRRLIAVERARSRSSGEYAVKRPWRATRRRRLR